VKIRLIVNTLDYVPDELQGLERALADTYFCNFSVFQSRARLVGRRAAVPDDADPPPRRAAHAHGRSWPTSPATATARSTSSSTCTT
jgi:hypothetical protein